MVADLDEAQARELLEELRLEHRSLDREVAALAEQGGDQLRIMRLKRQKLALKDRISRLEDELHPDIIA